MNSFFNSAGAIEPSYAPDMSGELDTEAELLADAYEISLKAATAICAHYHDSAARERWETAAPIVLDVIRWVIQPSRNLKAKIWGLVFSSELADAANGNKTEGIDSMADEARKMGCSRALLSHYKRDCDKLFGRYGRVFGKSPEACEQNRRARLRVLQRERAPTPKTIAPHADYGNPANRILGSAKIEKILNKLAQNQDRRREDALTGVTPELYVPKNITLPMKPDSMWNVPAKKKI